jgi:hypothetical protein
VTDLFPFETAFFQQNDNFEIPQWQYLKNDILSGRFFG